MQAISIVVLSLCSLGLLVASSDLDHLVTEHVVPDVISSKPAGKIEIVYPSGASVNFGNELTPTAVKDMPKFKYPSEPGKLYTLAIVDPDVPSRKDPKFGQILHFLAVNIAGDKVESGDTLAEYVGSGPPKGSGLHRYVSLVYEQPGKVTSDMKKIARNQREGRRMFSIEKFAERHHLGSPKAANFYLAQFDDYVPILHKQLNITIPNKASS